MRCYCRWIIHEFIQKINKKHLRSQENFVESLLKKGIKMSQSKTFPGNEKPPLTPDAPSTSSSSSSPSLTLQQIQDQGNFKISENFICPILTKQKLFVSESKICENVLKEILNKIEEIFFCETTQNLASSKNIIERENIVAEIKKTNKTLRKERKEMRKRSRISVKDLRVKGKMFCESSWKSLPPELLCSIYGLLSMRDRHSASQVCRHWFQCFYIPSVWTHFILDDLALTKRKFNYYLGYQRMLDPFKTQVTLQCNTLQKNITFLVPQHFFFSFFPYKEVKIERKNQIFILEIIKNKFQFLFLILFQAYLRRFGSFLRYITIDPMSNFYNLFEFLKILYNYSEAFSKHWNENPLSRVRQFNFKFGCQFSSSDFTGNEHQTANTHRRTISLYNFVNNGGPIGTGGRVLEALIELLDKFDGLESLTLTNLFLDLNDAQSLLDQYAIKHHLSLRHLTLINCSRRPYSFLHCGVFLNLTSIALSPQVCF